MMMMSELKGYVRKPILIDICHTHCLYPDSQPMTIEEAVRGTYYQLDDHTMIIAYDSTDASGKRLTNTLKIEHGCLTWIKIGQHHARQRFLLNEWMNSQFFYEGSSLVCRNHTRKLDYSLNDKGGVIDVLYELWSAHSHLGFYNLELSIHP